MPIIPHFTTDVRPIASILMTGGGGNFPQILDLFRGLKLEFPVAVYGKPRFLK